ncbi:MAG: hypothetical protein HKN41_02800 [Ilumatobacter sp.]|nr:hypothetical protein [Ilumatobacter sp.]
MISVEMLLAERGDAILLEYGAGDEPTSRILIDGGPVNAGVYEGVRERLLAVPVGADGRRHFDLLVITHVDADHVEGVIRLLQDDELRCTFDDIWFNGWHHLASVAPTVAVLGGRHGEFLSALLAAQGRPHNMYLGGGAVFVPDEGALPVIDVRGGLRLTLLSPTKQDLEELARDWDVTVRNAGFTPGDRAAALAQLSGEWWARPPVLGDDDRIRASGDRSAANGSSIAALAEFGGRSVLLAGDAHDDVLVTSLRRLRTERAITDPLPIDALKLSHHGSRHNTTAQLLAELSADHYLVSSSGDRFDHPDAETIRTVIDRHNGDDDPVLLCNYEQPQTTIWTQVPGVRVRFGADAVLHLDTA